MGGTISSNNNQQRDTDRIPNKKHTSSNLKWNYDSGEIKQASLMCIRYF